MQLKPCEVGLELAFNFFHFSLTSYGIKQHAFYLGIHNILADIRDFIYWLSFFFFFFCVSKINESLRV